jgi:hypothetical protein
MQSQAHIKFNVLRCDNKQHDFLDAKSWCLSLASGEAPSQRTCHSAAAIDNKLFIFGGGHSGAEPVQDNKLYVYNASKGNDTIF